VVADLRRRSVPVTALVRNATKAAEVLPPGDDLTIVACDHGDAKDVTRCVAGCDAAVWCATGFADAPAPEPVLEEEPSLFEKLKEFLGMSEGAEAEPIQEPAAPGPETSIDLIGVPALAEAMAVPDGESEGPPRVVMLSSAGVTRPAWDTKKKERYPGAADIPIVRLNPFGILGIKADSEERLRQSGTPYCIFRPTGLNDDWPQNSRPVLSQGDLAVGRIHRADVASLLVDCLLSPHTAGVTFEASTLAGYAPGSADAALSRLRRDAGGAIGEGELDITYNMLQQVLPGEKQDAAALAMGQTYEQLDVGETGRLGERGEEDAEVAAPKPTGSGTM